MFRWCMMKNTWFSFDNKKIKKKCHKHQKPHFKKKLQKSLKKNCMIRCNLMKKEGQKSLTLSVWRKPLNIWPRKWPKKKKFREKGSREELKR